MIIDLQKIQDDVAYTRQILQTIFERLERQQYNSTTFEETSPLNIDQAADFLNISRQTIYQNIQKIPHRKRHGKLLFFRAELIAYLDQSIKA